MKSDKSFDYSSRSFNPNGYGIGASEEGKESVLQGSGMAVEFGDSVHGRDSLPGSIGADDRIRYGAYPVARFGSGQESVQYPGKTKRKKEDEK